ncbi:MAG: sugar ABC transporter substrate-binding protein [Clostridiales bacterium]|nr:sugar ABC transporter substrate-binding protein [Clostridiales bacterium]
MKKLTLILAFVLITVVAFASSASALTVGFCNIAETAEQHYKIKENMEAAAKERGWELVYMNNKLDGQTAVANADAMLLRDIDYFIEFNVDISVAPTIMEKMDEAGIPVIAVDIEHPGAVYFGANNFGVGPIVGKYLGEIVKARWEAADALLIIEDSISGETVLARTDNVVDGFKEIFPDFADENIYYIDGGQDPTEAQEITSNFLSAHPDLEKIAIAPAHSTYRIGAQAAIETAGRELNCLMVSQGEYDYFEYLDANPEAPEWEVYTATLVYDFKNYGNYCMSIIDKMEAGEEVPDYNYPTHYIIDRSNVDEFFPEEA